MLFSVNTFMPQVYALIHVSSCYVSQHTQMLWCAASDC